MRFVQYSEELSNVTAGLQIPLPQDRIHGQRIPAGVVSERETNEPNVVSLLLLSVRSACG